MIRDTMRKARIYGRIDAIHGNFAHMRRVSLDGYHSDAYWQGHDSLRRQDLARWDARDTSFQLAELVFCRLSGATYQP